MKEVMDKVAQIANLTEEMIPATTIKCTKSSGVEFIPLEPK
jgi:hypothetical protein